MKSWLMAGAVFGMAISALAVDRSGEQTRKVSYRITAVGVEDAAERAQARLQGENGARVVAVSPPQCRPTRTAEPVYQCDSVITYKN